MQDVDDASIYPVEEEGGGEVVTETEMVHGDRGIDSDLDSRSRASSRSVDSSLGGLGEARFEGSLHEAEEGLPSSPPSSLVTPGPSAPQTERPYSPRSHQSKAVLSIAPTPDSVVAGDSSGMDGHGAEGAEGGELDQSFSLLVASDDEASVAYSVGSFGGADDDFFADAGEGLGGGDGIEAGSQPSSPARPR